MSPNNRARIQPARRIAYEVIRAVHESDAVEAFAHALTADTHGPFNIVGSGVLPLSTTIRLAGSTPLPLPRVLTRPGLSALAALGLSPAPAAVLDFLRYPFVADGEHARRELGFVPRYSTREAVLSLSGGA